MRVFYLDESEDSGGYFGSLGKGTVTSRVIALLHPFQSKDASIKFLTSFATLAWSIWKSRNRYILDQVKISPTGVILEAQLNSSPAIGIIARNCNGSLLHHVAEMCRSESVLAAKLSAIRSACILAATNGWNPAIIESDSQSAISLAAIKTCHPGL
ncbi:F-box domain containing protein [Tanacetum coccineum]